MDIRYFQKINNLQGMRSKKEAELYKAKRQITTDLIGSLLAEDVLVNGCRQTVIISDDSIEKKTKKVNSLPNEYLNYGDIVNWNGSNWIVIELDPNRQIYTKGIMKPCVGQLKWLDSDGLVKEYPFTFKSDPATNFGVNDGRIMSMGNERRNLMAPSNDDTMKISKGKRFIIDRKVWTVSSDDRISVDGLVNLTLDEDLKDNASDNFELGIADYYGKVANYTLTILNETSFSIRAGRTLQLNSELRNNGILANKPLVYTSSNTNIATVDNDGLITTIANGTVEIRVSMADDLSVTDSINGTVEFTTRNNYVVSLTDNDPFVYLNKSKTFTAVVKNNGVIDNTKFVTWYLFADDKVSSTSLATMTFNSTTQCTLKGNDGETGYVQLKVIIVGDSQPHWVRVEVKSLI